MFSVPKSPQRFGKICPNHGFESTCCLGWGHTGMSPLGLGGGMLIQEWYVVSYGHMMLMCFQMKFHLCIHHLQS